MKKLFIYFLLISILAACNSTKHVAEDKHMLTENIIYIDSVKKKGGELEKYILQKPNSRFLNVPFGLYFHNIGNHNNPKTPKEWGEKNKRSYNFVKNIFSEKQSIAYANTFIKLNNWFLKYDAPVLINQRKIKNTADNLSAYYKTLGYFKSTVNTKINKQKDKKATVAYYINKGIPTTIDTVNIKIESPVLDSIYKASGSKTFLKSGNQYDDLTFRKEAKNNIKLFRNNGVYYFSESALGFYVDSTRTDYKTNVDFIISKNRLVEEKGKYVNKPFNVHKIKEIDVITDYSFSKKGQPYLDSISYNGIRFLAYDKVRYNPKYLSQSIFLKPNDVYKDTLRNLTRDDLISLKNFKSTSIKFDPIFNSKDELKMNVFLTPIEKFTLGFETELTHSNIREIGASAKFSILNRNTFKGAELLKLSFLGSYFNSKSGPGWEIGTDISLEVPRFIAPFGIQKLVPKRMSPKTIFTIGTSLQKNIGLDKEQFSSGINYKWNFNRRKTIQIEAFNIQYIGNLNINQYFTIYSSEFNKLKTIQQAFFPNKNLTTETAKPFFTEALADTDFSNNNPAEYLTVFNIQNRYNIITSNFIIPTISYAFNYNTQTDFKDNTFSSFKFKISNSGNFIAFLSSKKNENGVKTIDGTQIAQYFKTDIEYKKFWDLSNNSVIGFRSFLGAIIPYGNSDIPFSKSYFAGGSNDVRAWKTYELGPGSTPSILEFNTGSLKLLSSLEYRFDVFGNIKGALFVDAGNIWDISNYFYEDNPANFNGFSSLGDIAVGSGFGLRYDLSFLVFRLDVGFKTYEPYLTDKKWFKNYNFNRAEYNIGINYPF